MIIICRILRDLLAGFGLHAAINGNWNLIDQNVMAWDDDGRYFRVWIINDIVHIKMTYEFDDKSIVASLSDPNCFKVIEEFVNCHR